MVEDIHSYTISNKNNVGFKVSHVLYTGVCACVCVCGCTCVCVHACVSGGTKAKWWAKKDYKHNG